ncbi:hypothetical protein EDB86DRAFT_3243344 [Lactarius hatsudake]|nr:hypothetical protein EDB86DRAFT_3243344 [Lactarius hatsudake]
MRRRRLDQNPCDIPLLSIVSMSLVKRAASFPSLWLFRGVRSQEHQIVRVPCRRREREFWSAPEILHEALDVSDAACCVAFAPFCRTPSSAVNGSTMATASVIRSRSRRRLRARLSLLQLIVEFHIDVLVPLAFCENKNRMHEDERARPLLMKIWPGKCVSLLVILGVEDTVVIINEVLRYHLIAKYSKRGDLEDEARICLEDTDEDEEERESASSSNGKAVDAELELADGVWGTPAAEGGDKALRSSFAEDDNNGSSDDREMRQRRVFQAYEHSHRIGPNLLVHEHAPVVLLLAILDLGHPDVEPPQSTSELLRRWSARCGSSLRSVAAAWIALNEPNIVFCSTFRRAVRRGHPSTSTGAGDGAGTMRSFLNRWPELGLKLWWESQCVRSIARFLMDRRSDKDRVGEEVVFLRLEEKIGCGQNHRRQGQPHPVSPQIHQRGRLRYRTQLTAMAQIGDGATGSVVPVNGGSR